MTTPSQLQRYETPEDTSIRELSTALRFYAQNIYRSKSTRKCAIQTPIEHDCGDRARQALARYGRKE